jgi:hypothetical protein
LEPKLANRSTNQEAEPLSGVFERTGSNYQNPVYSSSPYHAFCAPILNGKRNSRKKIIVCSLNKEDLVSIINLTDFKNNI